MRQIFPTCLILLLGLSLSRAQSITTSALTSNSVCAGDNVTVSYSATGLFVGKNAFTVQLSDSDGLFASSFLNLGSIKSLSSGQITVAVPSDTKTSTHYRMRVIGSNPYTVGSDNGSDITIAAKPNIGLEARSHYVLEGETVVFKNRSSGATSYSWDLGAGATPATSFAADSVEVTYSTPGRKTITLTGVSAAGCSSSASIKPSPVGFDRYGLEVYSCSPIIPHDAIVDSVDQDFGTGNGPVWVVPGTTFISQTGDFTVFAEPGSSVHLPGTGSLTVYLKAGASYTGGSTGSHRIIYTPGAALNKINHETLIQCPSLSFDYSIAPPYKVQAQPEAVFRKAATQDIRTHPNPAASMLYVQMDESPIGIELLNELGTVALSASGPLTNRLQLNVLSLTPGTYYLRLTFPGKQEMRKVLIQR